MKIDVYTKVILTTIAFLLAVIALKDIGILSRINLIQEVSAQSDDWSERQIYSHMQRAMYYCLHGAEFKQDIHDSEKWSMRMAGSCRGREGARFE